MTEIGHTASPRGPHAAAIDRGTSTSHRIDPPREGRLCQDTVAMDWLRLRTIVDALLCRAAASKDVATAIDATRNRAGAATNTTPQTQEATHG